jgi:GNAT superfamily N-acetyltransferase
MDPYPPEKEAVMSTIGVRVVPVQTEAQVRAFVKFPWQLYRNDPHWVPPLYGDELDRFNPDKNPFYEHGEVQPFLAVRGDEVVGRITAHVDDLHNEVHQDQVGFFGFLETIDDYPVAEALLSTATDWLRDRGKDAMRGPHNLTQNDVVGMLVDGDPGPPAIMMPYNPPYLPGLVERFGLTKAMDLWAWMIRTNIFDYQPEKLPRKFVRVAEAARNRDDLVVRPVNMKDFDNEVAKVKVIYNKAWERNWGFVRLTDHEIEHIGQQLKMILDPELVLLAEVDGEPVGVSLGIPDVNQALLRAYPQPNKWSFPITVAKLLWYQRRIDTFRSMIMGVVPEYRERGIDAVFYVETARAAMKKGYKFCEMSWILENNDMMNRIIERLGGRIYKTYRVYQKPV